ncbi:immunoglobulin domain-containing protein [Alistipes sp.]|uniref:immunoglobulin domain-containing protein n=1 Tax=Alistipes sp. TaxID=1872444 RepID=UPI003AF1D67E
MKKFYAFVLAIGFLTIGALEANGSATVGSPSPPEFVRKPTNLTVKEGQKAVWTFEISGNPVPSVSVLKNGDPIDISDRFELLYKYPLVTFRIIVVYPEDEGDYTFVLTNAAGTASQTVKLTVEKL